MTQSTTSLHPVHNDHLDHKILQACNAVGDFIEYWGFKGVYGRVWSILALHNAPMTQVEIARFLGISRSLVSMAIAELVELGLVRAVSPNRNAPYTAVVDVWPTISDVLRSREWMLIETARIKLEAAIEETTLREAQGHSGTYNVQRMKFLLRMTEIAQGLLRILIAIRTPRQIGDLRQWIGSVRNLFQSLPKIA